MRSLALSSLAGCLSPAPALVAAGRGGAGGWAGAGWAAGSPRPAAALIAAFIDAFALLISSPA